MTVTDSSVTDSDASSGDPQRDADFLTIALFDEGDAAAAAVARCVQAGIPTEQLAAICSDESKLAGIPEAIQEETAAENEDDAILSGGAVAAGAGLALTAGALLTAAGLPLVAIGTLAASAVTGPFAAVMLSRGLDDAAADFYDREVGDGKVLIAVEPASELARSLLAEAGGRTFDLPVE